MVVLLEQTKNLGASSVPKTGKDLQAYANARGVKQYELGYKWFGEELDADLEHPTSDRMKRASNLAAGVFMLHSVADELFSDVDKIAEEKLRRLTES